MNYSCINNYKNNILLSKKNTQLFSHFFPSPYLQFLSFCTFFPPPYAAAYIGTHGAGNAKQRSLILFTFVVCSCCRSLFNMPPKKCEGEPSAKKRMHKASDIQLTFAAEDCHIVTANADPMDEYDNSISIINNADGDVKFQATFVTVKTGDDLCSFFEKNSFRRQALDSSRQDL